MIRLFALLFLSLLHFSCKETPKNLPQDNARPRKANYSESQLNEADTSSVPMSMVRNIKQARNGDILIASYLGVFRYDARLNDSLGQGASFTNITSTIIAPRFSSFWDVLEDRKGNLWFGSKDSGVYYYNARLNDGVGQGKTITDFKKLKGAEVVYIADNFKIELSFSRHIFPHRQVGSIFTP